MAGSQALHLYLLSNSERHNPLIKTSIFEEGSFQSNAWKGNLCVRNNTLELLLSELNVALGRERFIKDPGMIRIPLPTGQGALPKGQPVLPTQIVSSNRSFSRST